MESLKHLGKRIWICMIFSVTRAHFFNGICSTWISHQTRSYTLPETNIFAPENGWLEYDPFLLGPGLFSGVNLLLVSGRV